MHFEPWQWALLIAGAFVVGLAKTGIAGLGILFVAVINLAIPARQATGVILPMLILGDVFGVGPLAIGDIKYKCESGLFKQMLTSDKPLALDFRHAYAMAKSLTGLA